MKEGGKAEMEEEKRIEKTPEFNIADYPQIERVVRKTGEKKLFYVVPDELFEEHLKELPEGTFNESKTFRAYNGGKLYQLDQDPEEAARRGRTGAEASNSTQAARRSFADECKIALATKDKNGKTAQENAVIAMIERAQMGDVKAAQFLRDTVGEKPAESIDLNADITTEADRALMEKLKARMMGD